ncbi:zinc-ribbon domain-containing protein [bacterium]|nr:zinc-ribbon domain-containing protein [bacterium]
MFCPKCGKQIDDGGKFCSNCGFKIEPKSLEGEKKDKKDDIFIEDKKNVQKTVGNIKKVIEAIIVRKGKGDPLLIINIRKKLVFKGINPAKYTYETIDDPLVLKKLIELAKDLGFNL